jgi:hypothetical protein
MSLEISNALYRRTVKRRKRRAPAERDLQVASTCGWARGRWKFFARAGVRELKRRERRAPQAMPLRRGWGIGGAGGYKDFAPDGAFGWSATFRSLQRADGRGCEKF